MGREEGKGRGAKGKEGVGMGGKGLPLTEEHGYNLCSYSHQVCSLYEPWSWYLGLILCQM